MNSAADALFDGQRPRLLGLAYRLLGSLADAEDVVQETWIRWGRSDQAAIERPEAWLTTVCSRIGLDRLRQRQRDRLEYVGPWLPEPLIDRQPSDPADDPAARAELSDSLTTAFLVLLERLRPEERIALLLADVFGEPFEAVAGVLGRSESSCRQLASRARRKLRDEPARRVDPPVDAWRVAHRFAAAIHAGDLAEVTRLLAPDVVLVSDGGAAQHAARRPVVGPDRVARFVVNVGKRFTIADGPPIDFEAVSVNGAPALLASVAGRAFWVQAVEVSDGLIRSIAVVVNRDKLARSDRRIELL